MASSSRVSHWGPRPGALRTNRGRHSSAGLRVGDRLGRRGTELALSWFAGPLRRLAKTPPGALEDHAPLPAEPVDQPLGEASLQRLDAEVRRDNRRKPVGLARPDDLVEKGVDEPPLLDVFDSEVVEHDNLRRLGAGQRVLATTLIEK